MIRFGMRVLLALLGMAILLIPSVMAQEENVMKLEAESVDVELTINPFPIEPDVPTNLDIRFIEKGSDKTQIHVDYILYIKDQDGNEIFRTPLTHTNEGEITVPFIFSSKGSHTIGVEVQGILFQPIPTETVEFSVNVIPEFPIGILAVFGAITIISIIFARKQMLIR